MILSNQTVQRYDLIQRIYHWANLGALLVLLWTGLTIYDLNIFGTRPFSSFVTTLVGENFMPLIFGLHIYAAFALLGGLIMHIIYDTGIKGIFWSEIPSKADFKAQNILAKNFLGISKEYVKFPKFNIGQKMLHIGFAIVIVLIGATGFMMNADYRFLVPIWWLPLSFDFISFWARYIHDMLTFVLITMVVMHVYFGVRRENAPTFKSMFSGTVPKEYQEKHFSSSDEPELIPAPDEEG